MDRLRDMANRERVATAELIAHLAELDTRSLLYAAKGFGSLFRYCTDALGFSEDAACARIDAARAVRRFPVVLDHLASGSLTVTALRIIGKHLTVENHEELLRRASGLTVAELTKLAATLAPRPDAAPVIRRAEPKLSAPMPSAPSLFDDADVRPAMAPVPVTAAPVASPAAPTSSMVASPTPRSTVEPTASNRYRLHITLEDATFERMRRVQTLLRRQIPDGDPATLFDRGLVLLEKEAERAAFGATQRARATSKPIRFKTDSTSSTYIPRPVKRAVWRRDGGRCAFVSLEGRRCAERAYLEYHHIHPSALGGPPTAENVSLRCRRHNDYERELVFGPRALPGTRAK